MTNHHFFNIALAVVAAATLVAGTTMTPETFEADAARERREWMFAVQACHRAFGPNTGPEYDDAGHLVCVGRKGQQLGPVQMVASK